MLLRMVLGVVRQLRPFYLWAVCLYVEQVRVLLVQQGGGGGLRLWGCVLYIIGRR